MEGPCPDIGGRYSPGTKLKGYVLVNECTSYLPVGKILSKSVNWGEMNICIAQKFALSVLHTLQKCIE